MIALDKRKNFAYGVLSTGYNNLATTIVLTTGHGARFGTGASDVPFNAVWWDYTSYPNPSEDPNAEIIRVTNITADTLTITRAQEGTSATNKNTAGKTYRLALTVTKKLLDDIESQVNADVTNLQTQLNSLIPFGGNGADGDLTAGNQSGTGTVTSSGTTVNGTGTAFSTDFIVGEYIIVGAQARQITQINSNTQLIIASAFSPDIVSSTAYTRGKYTTVDLAGAQLFIKNYNNITINGYGAVRFINPHSAGTVLLLKAKGNVDITSTAVAGIDLRGIGATGGAGGAGNRQTGGGAGTAGGTGNTGNGVLDDTTHGGGSGGAGQSGGSNSTAGGAGTVATNLFLYTNTQAKLVRKGYFLACGNGGGGGGGGYKGVNNGANDGAGHGGAGGRGGGALLLEVNGAFNFTTGSTINFAGQDGGVGNPPTYSGYCGSGGGGGGGSEGMAIIIARTITANTGTMQGGGGAGAVGGTTQAGGSNGGGGGAGGGGASFFGAGAGGGAGGGYGTGSNGSSASAGTGAGGGGGGGGGSNGAVLAGGTGGTGGTQNTNSSNVITYVNV